MLKSLPDGAVKIAPRSGVYFILDDDENVIYIGASKNVDHRSIESRNKLGARAAYCIFHDGDAASLAALEQRYIDRYKPKMNSRPKSGYHGVHGIPRGRVR